MTENISQAKAKSFNMDLTPLTLLCHIYLIQQCQRKEERKGADCRTCCDFYACGVDFWSGKQQLHLAVCRWTGNNDLERGKKRMSKPTKSWIENTMKALDCTEEEALEMWEDDADIEVGEDKDFDLTPEQEKIAKKYRGTGKRKGEPVKRERKPNAEKREIIEDICGFIAQHCEYASETSIVNPERQIDFTVGGNHYSITLTCHRKPKGGGDGKA